MALGVLVGSAFQWILGGAAEKEVSFAGFYDWHQSFVC